MRVTQKGGTIELTGGTNNKYVKSYFKMSNEELSKMGFEVLERKTISSDGYFTTSGNKIGTPTLEQIILKKK